MYKQPKPKLWSSNIATVIGATAAALKCCTLSLLNKNTQLKIGIIDLDSPSWISSNIERFREHRTQWN